MSSFGSASSSSSSVIEAPEHSVRSYAPARKAACQWVCDPAFGVVHPEHCSTCRHYMSHFIEGSRETNDTSFNAAIMDRDGKETARFFEGVEEGKSAQRDKDRTKLARYRGERDDERVRRRGAEEEARRLRAELRELKDAFMAMQITYEEQISVLTFGPSRMENELEALKLMELQAALFEESRAEISAELEDAGVVSDTDCSAHNRVLDARRERVTLPDPRSLSDEENEGDKQEDGVEDREGGGEGENHTLSLKRARELMEALSQQHIDPTALVQLRDLCLDAHRTPAAERTKAHKFVLKEAWKIPTVLCNKPKYSSETTLVSVPEIFVDASGRGLGFLWDNRWAAWNFLKGWMSEGRHMPWAEMVAVELGIRTLIASGVHSTHVRVRSDNQSVVTALSRRSIKAPQDALILESILKLCRTHQIVIMPIWVWTKHNPADPLSRGIYPSRDLYVDAVIPIPKHLSSFVSDIRQKKSA